MTKVLTPAAVTDLIKEIQALRARIASLEETAVELSRRNRELQARLDALRDLEEHIYHPTENVHIIK